MGIGWISSEQEPHPQPVSIQPPDDWQTLPKAETWHTLGTAGQESEPEELLKQTTNTQSQLCPEAFRTQIRNETTSVGENKNLTHISYQARLPAELQAET